MWSTHEGHLPLPSSDPAITHAHVLPDLATAPLVSVGQLCDAKCTVKFTSKKFVVRDEHGKFVMQGGRDLTNGLWTLPIQQQINAAVGLPSTADRVAFSHAALFSPALSTLLEALNREFLVNFPALTAKNLRKHPPNSVAMHKGHMDQQRMRRTEKSTPSNSTFFMADDDHMPLREKTHACFVSLQTMEDGQIFSDQTGAFPTTSTRGYKYIMVVYDYDTNAIIVEPTKNKTAETMVSAFSILHSRLTKAGFKPKLHRLDNECSDLLKLDLKSKGLDFQLVPPGCHRRNAAERAIRTFKNHFIAGLCSVNPKFPIGLWCRLLPQAEMTLNLLRPSHTNPKVSAYNQLEGIFDFVRTPLAPPGIKVLGYEDAGKRRSWSSHARDGWYIGPAMEAYQCYKIFASDTRAVITCNQVQWFPHAIKMPTPSTDEIIIAKLNNVIHAIKHPSDSGPTLTAEMSTSEQLEEIFQVIQRIAPNTRAPLPPTESAPLPRVEAEDEPAPEPAPLPRVEAPPEPPVPAPRVGLNVIPPDNTQPEAAPIETMEAPEPVPAEGPAVTFTDECKTTDGPNARPNIIENDDAEPVKKPTAKPKMSQPRRSKRRRGPMRRAVPKQRGPPAMRQRWTRSAKRKARKNYAEVQANQLQDAFLHNALHGHAVNPDTGKIAQYKELSQCSEGPLWTGSSMNEWGRLMKGHQTMASGTDTFKFIARMQIPDDKKATYMAVVCAFRPEKEDPHRVRFVAGGDQVEYNGNTYTKTADLTTVKVHFNSVVSTKNAKHATGDLKNFYLMSRMKEEDWAYMKVPAANVPTEILDFYDAHHLIEDGFIYVQVHGGMYGLPHAGKLANEDLEEFLEPHGYYQAPHTAGLWLHKTRPISFTLIVDDFGVKYVDKADADHLFDTLKEKYEVSIDWGDKQHYGGLTVEWDYEARTCTISLPGYIERALIRFMHPRPRFHEASPHEHPRKQYGVRTQLTEPPDETPALDLTNRKMVREVVGVLLFYARAIDGTILPALGSLSGRQNKPTKKTMIAITKLLNYCASNPDAKVRFHASEMILHVESDASYLSEDEARSRAAGYFYLSNQTRNLQDPDAASPLMNGAIHIFCRILQEVMASAAEAEIGALFHNARDACPLRIMLQEMGHPQPPTPIVSDNSTAVGIANNTVKQRRSKAIDMRFYWIRDRVRQGQFVIYWKRGETNRADYFSKHHAPVHHIAMRPVYLHTSHNRFSPLEGK